MTTTKGVTPPSEESILRSWARSVEDANLGPDARCGTCGCDGDEHGLALRIRNIRSHKVHPPGYRVPRTVTTYEHAAVCLACMRERWES